MEKKPMHILIADDDDDDQFILLEAITEMGSDQIRITPVYNGAQLMDFLNKKNCFANEIGTRPDLILLDINMPVVNGLEALAKLKSDSNLKDIPVYMISTLRCQKHYTICRDLGALGYFSKPNNVGDYRRIMENIFCNSIYSEP
jgi:CheY-like chemotaxis protein